MRKLLICLTAIACVAVLSTVAKAQCGTLFGDCLGNGNLDAVALAPWTLTNVGNATAAQLQGGFADNTGVNGVWYRSFLGGGTNMNPLVSADLSQTTVPVLMDGTYLLTFDRVVENNFTAGSLTATLSSSSGASTSVDLLTKKVTNASYMGGGFDLVGTTAPEYNITETLLLSGVSAGDTLTVSLAMVDGQDAGANPQSVVADNFRLMKVPEPSTVVLGALGMLGIGWAARRRK